MKAFAKTNAWVTILSVLPLIAFAVIFPHAFAQPYTDADNPHGPMQPIAWAALVGVAGVMSGVGVWTAVRRRRLH